MSRGGRCGRSLVVAAMVLSTAAWADAGSGGRTSRVSVGSTGQQANEPNASYSYSPAISAHGRYVVFLSFASNLVAGDTNGAGDVFVRDRRTGSTERVSLGPGARQGNDGNGYPTLSARARFVVFTSTASNLVTGDTNRRQDVFVRDRLAGLTQRVSVSSDSRQANEDSGVYSPAVISGGGRFVAFDSLASNLVPADSNAERDVFVRDRRTGVTQRVSLGPNDSQASGGSAEPSMSADGRYVAFISSAANLVPGDTNGEIDVFVRDRWSGTTRRVLAGWNGQQPNGPSGQSSISADGRYVTFYSSASNLAAGDTNGAADLFVWERQTGVIQLVSVGLGALPANGGSYQPQISGNGRYIVFTSEASNLVAGDTNELLDIFVRDRLAGVTRRVSINTGGEQTSPPSEYLGASSSPSISTDGRHISFHSSASNLVPDDTNGEQDVFVRDTAGESS